MGSTNRRHRKLVSGIWIGSGRIKAGKRERIARGTLTAVATRVSDNRKVLVTNRHVMTGVDSNRNFIAPSNDEQMYQPTYQGRLVGVRPSFQPLGAVDLAVLDVADNSVGLGMDLHDLPRHTSRPIIPGTPNAVDGEKLVMMGARGEQTVTVDDVDEIETLGGVLFRGLVKLKLTDRATNGNSGSGCYRRTSDGKFQLVCIYFAGGRRTGWAFNASLAQTLAGIRFGNHPPVANAGPAQTVQAGDTVTLDGSHSRDADYDSLTYRWEQAPGVGGRRTLLSNQRVSKPTFTAPAAPAALTFKLTVTDEFGATDTATTDVTVVAEEIWGEWADTDPVEYRYSLARRERRQIRTSNLGNEEERWVTDREPVHWGPWVDTDPIEYRGELAGREKKQTRTSNYGLLDITWVSDPEPVVWGEWSRTGQVRGEGASREVEEERTSNYEVTERQWVPEPERWGDWKNTGEYRGELGEREQRQTRTSNLKNIQSKWVSDPVPEVWPAWRNTNRYQGSLSAREREEVRTSNYGNVQRRWVPDPEPEIWPSAWSDTSNYRGKLGERELEQTQRSNYGNIRNRWVSRPEAIVWYDWESTSETRGELLNRERRWTRSSNYGTTQDEWRADPVVEDWGPWTNTGRTRGTLANRERRQERTSNLGGTQARWVSDPEPETWNAWRNTNRYQGSLSTREQEQTRRSNYGKVERRWVSAPEPVTWGAWADTGRTRYVEDLQEYEKEQRRKSNYGKTDTRWVFSHAA